MEIFILCIKIFVCRIVDVSLGTVRTILLVKGKTITSSLIALLEGLIWFLIVREALLFDLSEGKYIIAFVYSGGFATGTLVGSLIAKRFVDSMVQIQVVTTSKDDKIIESIQEAGFAITVIELAATKFAGEKYMLLSEIKHSHLNDFKALIHSLDEKAFIMIHETKYVYNGFFRTNV